MTTSPMGRELLYILPAVYRERDAGADLDHYLDGCGTLLDLLYATLRQRLADNFPDDPNEGLPAGAEPRPVCQDWLLPYFAALLDVRLASPLPAGRRAEIGHAVEWRQRKGTKDVIRRIARAVGQTEVFIQEGWRRVAITPRIGRPLLPALSLGYASEPQPFPALMARHPALHAATVDFRCPSRAVATTAANPAAERIDVDGEEKLWRQASLHGAPCFPGSYEDVSRRTVDFRSPDWGHGHYHPRRVLLYGPPPAGFFPPGAPAVAWADQVALAQLLDILTEGAVTTYRNKTFGTAGFVPVRIQGTVELGADATGDPDAHRHRFIGVVFEDQVIVLGGRLDLEFCAAAHTESQALDTAEPVLAARSCVFGTLDAEDSLVRLEYCAVLQETLCEVLQASDCLFLQLIRREPLLPAPPVGGCLRFARVQRDQTQGALSWYRVNREPVALFSEVFGERGCGVLHPATPKAVRFGAEDGGEMGAYHDLFYSLAQQAVIDKLQEFLPVGLEAGWIPDERLLAAPVA